VTTALSARSLTERVYVRLRGEILGGQLAPGQKLRPSELSAVHDVSLNVVREALSRLAGERLVRALPQQGFVVVELSVADLVDLTEVRSTIETAALRRSIERGDLHWESSLVAAHHELARTPKVTPDNPDGVNQAWMQAHNLFHQATLSGCGSQRLMEIIAGLGESASIYRLWSHQYDQDRRDISSEHLAIFEATLARDADLACRLHQEHIQRTVDIVIAAISATDEDPFKEN
jgi:GntR family transcriptional regulator, carbon starvation induced regulator